MAEVVLLLGSQVVTQLAPEKLSLVWRLGSLLALLRSNAMEAFDVDLAFSNDFDFFCHPGLAGNWSGGGAEATEDHPAQVGTSGPTSQISTQDQEVEERSRDSAVTDDDDDEQEDLLPVELRAPRKQLFFRKRKEETEKRDL